MRPFLVLAAAVLMLVAARAPGLEAGAAKSRLTIPQGMPLAGHADRKGREALGEHDPLWARCLYLEDGETAVYLLGVDLSHIPRALRDRVTELAAELAPKEQIFLTASHTYNGVGGMDQPIPMRWTSGRYHPEMLEIVAQALVATMESARDQKRRATLGYATARQQALSQNRFDREGPVDEQIGVIRVDDADGKAIAMVANLAARPDLAPESHHYHFSADFPGAYYKAMEELTDPECVAMFFAGASADQDPGNPEGKEGWEHVESIGRLLAARAKEAANGMTFRDVKITTNYREATLPPTLAGALLPGAAVFQSLELDGLQLHFLPGEPSVEIGQALRSRALAAGKAAHFTVGLANEHLGAFISRARFGDPRYQPATSWFGADAEAWILAEANALTGQGEAPGTPAEYPPLKPQMLDSASALSLQGPGYKRGFQQGLFGREHAIARYKENIETPVRDGRLTPADGLWNLWPSILDPSALALPALGISARSLLRGLDSDLVGEAEGFAAALGLPLDAALLLQGAALSLESDAETAVALAGTVVGVTGDRAGAEGASAAFNLDWPEAESPVMATVEPDTGHNFVCVNFDWQLGALAGMNDAGLVLCLTRNGLLGDPEVGGAAAALTIRHELQFSDDFDEAAARLRASDRLRGHQVLLLAQSAKGWRCAVFSFGKSVIVREPENGILFGLNLESGNGDAAARARYTHVAAQLPGEGLIGAADIQQALDGTPDVDDAMAAPWNPQTRASLVFIPGRLAVQAAFPSATGSPGAYKEFRLKKAMRNE